MRAPNPISSLLQLVLVALTACGGAGSSGTASTEESSGSSTGVATENPTSGSTSTGVTTGNPGSPSTSTGPDSVTEMGTTAPGCAPPTNDAPGADGATITIRNDTAAPVYVLPKSKFVCNYAQIEIEIDGANVHWDHPGVFPFPCDPTRCLWGCSDGGDEGLIINPGGVAEVPWNGAIWATETLSQACVDEFDCPDAGAECEARRAPGDVMYTARVHITDECPGALDACEACVDDVCELFVYEPNYVDTKQTYEASAVFPAGAAIVVE